MLLDVDLELEDNTLVRNLKSIHPFMTEVLGLYLIRPYSCRQFDAGQIENGLYYGWY